MRYLQRWMPDGCYFRRRSLFYWRRLVHRVRNLRRRMPQRCHFALIRHCPRTSHCRLSARTDQRVKVFCLCRGLSFFSAHRTLQCTNILIFYQKYRKHLALSAQRCIFAHRFYLTTMIMDTAVWTLQVTLPIADASFLRRLSGNMGRQVRTQRKPRNYYESPAFYRDLRAAEQDIADGKGLRVESKDALDALFLWAIRWFLRLAH